MRITDLGDYEVSLQDDGVATVFTWELSAPETDTLPKGFYGYNLFVTFPDETVIAYAHGKVFVS